jgi:uncharacterized protein YmfQ (DUF2313 family)
VTPRSPDAALHGMLALLAPGWALPRDADAVLGRLLSAPAAQLAAAEAAAAALLDEADPRGTSELLEDWERVAGLPDLCLGPAPTIAQRRTRLVQQLTQARGQSPAFFVAVAQQLGAATASVTEFREHDCEQSCEEPVNGPEWRFAWRLNLPAASVTEGTCEDGCETPLAVWGDTTVECVVRGLAPAHTIVLFAYG